MLKRYGLPCPNRKKQSGRSDRQIPNKTNLWRLLIKLAGDQAKITLGNKHRVAIVGPANVGKSTLYNQFVQAKESQAEVSPIPGTTRENQEAGAGIFSIIDTPGTDAMGTLGEEERLKALHAAEEADFLIIIFDAIQGIKKTEHELFETLKALKKPYVVVLIKIDLVNLNGSHRPDRGCQPQPQTGTHHPHLSQRCKKFTPYFKYNRRC